MIEIDYLQAKLHGIHSKSFLGENYNKLLKIRNIELLKKEILPEEDQLKYEKEIFTSLEKKFKEKTFTEIGFVAEFLNFENPFINCLLLRYELDNVKLIVSAFYKSEKKIEGLFKVFLKDSLDYSLMEESDISDIKSLKKIFEKSIFSFIIKLIEEKKDIFLIENALDLFYYERLIQSLEKLKRYEREILSNIVYFEINWQNIIWAFRTKLYYKKSYENVKETFLKFPGLIKSSVLETIFKIQFLPNEALILFKEYPSKYRELILEAFNEAGDFDLLKLEQKVEEALLKMYTKFFFLENFNILPAISFIYLKKYEYLNIIKLIEGLRYNNLMEKQ